MGHTVLVTYDSKGHFINPSSVGQRVGQRAQPRRPSAAPAWGCSGGCRSWAGWPGTSGSGMACPCSTCSPVLQQVSLAASHSRSSPVGEGEADGFLRPRLRAHAMSLLLSSAGHSKSQGQLRLRKRGNKFHLLMGGAAKNFWPF